MGPAAEDWFREIREASDRAIWSRGVEIARADRVRELGVEADRVLLGVRGATGERAPRVELLLEIGAWDCDCASPDDPCEHVAAAAIAWRQSRREGRPLPKMTLRTALRFTCSVRRVRCWGIHRKSSTGPSLLPRSSV